METTQFFQEMCKTKFYAMKIKSGPAAHFNFKPLTFNPILPREGQNCPTSDNFYKNEKTKKDWD